MGCQHRLYGQTPLIELRGLGIPEHVRIFAKLEFLNPGGSIKDRIVWHIVDQAERDGLLEPGATIIEGSSGNTGAAVAMIAAMKGYHAVITVPAKISVEKESVLRALGAEVIVSPAGTPPDSPRHYGNAALRIHQQRPGSFLLNQYSNPLNVDAHYRTTGPEIHRQMDGQVTAFVAAGSSGGTISGVGRYLKEQDPSMEVVLMDPAGSVYAGYFQNGVLDPAAIRPYQTEGAGKDHIAGCMDFSVLSDVIRFSDEAAFSMCWQLARQHGLLVGGSGGANVWGCVQLARRMRGPARIVTVLPDSGTRYLSKIYNPAWLDQHGITIGNGISRQQGKCPVPFC
ncbi:PLP-dependent cysteine synthase family protein [Roseibium sp. RKSG952]|uniref:PLP-dependent cysteine synthase family protein n=1 Tax=Roseibium sp. RKSG952 TaxID=2529384 RepID=UPI0012BBADB0|nr:cysteine synthase family protein [Roseibium sp. RKSG952]MTH95088.1 cysteine synthase family protein [Roseibium sp. RKSG952]